MKYTAVRYIIGIILLIVIVIIVCKNESQLNYRKIKADFVGGKAKKFIEKYRHEKGVYICEDDKKTLYLLLNGLLSEEDEKNVYFSNIKVVPNGNILNISYKENHGKDNFKKDNDNRQLYRIKLYRSFEKIRVFKNGKETHFDSIFI